jgi:hypothetical protein
MPGKKYLAPPKTPTTSWGEDRAADHQLVVVKNHPIEGDLDVFAEHGLREALDLLSWYRSDRLQGVSPIQAWLKI